MRRLALIFICLVGLLQIGVSQRTAATQAYARKKVPPEVSEKRLCGAMPHPESDATGASARPKPDSFCRPIQPPMYPPVAKEQGIQGSVILGIVVGTDGRVKDVRVIAGHPLLAPAAVDAVKTWLYKPYYVNDKPTEMETTVTVSFKLQDKEMWKEYVYPENGFAITLPSDPHPHESSQMSQGTAYSVNLPGGSVLSLHTMTASGNCWQVLEAQAKDARHRMEAGTAESNGFKALSVKEIAGTGYKGFQFVQQVPNGQMDYERWVCSAHRLFVFAATWRRRGEQQSTEIDRIVNSFRVLEKE